MSSPELVEHFDRIMRKIDGEMHRVMPAIDNERVGSLGSMTLRRLAAMSPTPTHALVDAMDRDPSQMSRVIRRLEEVGLLTRSSQHRDKRVSVLEITEKGRAHNAAAEGALQDIVAEISTLLTTEEYDELIRLLAKLS